MTVRPVPYRLLPTVATEHLRTVTNNMEGFFLGPMPAQHFVATFFGGQSNWTSPSRSFQGIGMDRFGNPDAKDIAEVVSRLAPSLHISTTMGPHNLVYKSTPTICAYEGNARSEGLDFAEMELIIHINNAPKDGFCDVGAAANRFPFEPHSDRWVRTRMASDVADLVSSQFRAFTFSVFIFGRFARLLMWDQSGVIVTEHFDYTQVDVLSGFIQRFSQAPPEVRGRDPTVSRIRTDFPIHLAPPWALEYLRSGGYPGGGSLTEKGERHRYFCLMKIPDRHDITKESDFIISYPPHYPPQPSPLGRATKPMYAYDISLGQLVFVKQYWRSGGVGRLKEGEVYSALEWNRTRNLPEFGRGNDIIRCRSSIPFLHGSPRTWGHPMRPVPEIHLYRMSLKTIGEPLTCSTSTRELISVVRDVMMCHDDAFFRAGVLHRNISLENILINKETRKGMLVDWGSSATFDPNKVPFPHLDRAGTWRYMSSCILHNPSAGHTLRDDRESVVYVLLWMTLNYTAHNKESADALSKFLRIFSDWEPFGDEKIGGKKKKEFYHTSFSDHIKVEDGRTLPDLISTLQSFFFHRCFRPNEWLPLSYIVSAKHAYQAMSAPGWLVGVLDAALEKATSEHSNPQLPTISAGRKRPPGDILQSTTSCPKRFRSEGHRTIYNHPGIGISGFCQPKDPGSESDTSEEDVSIPD